MKSIIAKEDSGLAWIRLLLVFILCALGFIGMWSVVMILPSIETEFQISRSSVTIPYVLTMFGFGIGNIIVGKFSDKYGIKKPIIFGFTILIALYFVSGQGVDSFNILALQGGQFSDLTLNVFGTTFSFAKFFFIMLFIGFAIKVPVFPFHTWLPHAHVQAPTAVSVILAGVLLKMGTYGFLRIAFPIFPGASVYFKEAIAWLGLVNIIYGALCAMAQTDVKKLIAYSSVSHMGFVMVGLAAMTIQGTNGAVLQMFNHGCSTAMMFLMIGVLYERSHHRWIVRPDGTKGFGGLYTQLPKFSIIFIISMFASMGLPGLSGFISEALIPKL